MSSPAAPAVLYINPQFAGDSFASRRLQPQQPRQLSGSGATIAVDVQILLASTSAATALSISLANAPALLATGVASSLWSQGSPLAGLQITVTVEPYSDSALVAASSPNASASPALAAGAAVAAIAALALAACCLFYYRATHRRAASVAPAADGAGIDSRASMLPQPPPKQRPEAAALQLHTVIEGQDWRSFNREFLTGADMDFLVALGALDADGKRVGAVTMSADVRARFSTAVLDRLVAFGVLSS